MSVHGRDYNNTVRLLLLHPPNLVAAYGLPRSGYTVSRISAAPALVRGSRGWQTMAVQRRIRPMLITNDNWLGGNNNWNNAASWSAGVPTANNNVFIDNGHAGVSVVTLNVAGAVNNLTIDSDDSLSFANNTSLTVSGNSIANAGAISLNSAGNFTDLIIGSANVTLSGAGTLTMGNASTNNRILGAVGADVLTNSSTIQGSGFLGAGQMGLVNSGTIDANQPANVLNLQTSSGVTNTGILEATSGATLNLIGGNTYTNTGGTILASGTGSVVNLETGVTINGGILNTSSGGVVQTPGGHTSTLSGVTNTGTYAVQNNGATTLSGTITNNGTIQLNSAGNFTDLIIGSANVTLSGAGTVTMGNASTNNRILGAVGADVLTNSLTIQGSGFLGAGQMGLVNSGTIDANQPANVLNVQTSSGTTNTGTLEATNGATLNLIGGNTYTNTGGTIKAVGTGSIVNLESGVAITGGTLTTTGTGIVETPAGHTSTLTGVTNTGTYAVQNNGATLLSGTITNSGTIQLNSAGNFTELQIIGPTVTLQGAGTVTLSDNVANLIFGQAQNNSETLINQQTITGPAGNIGDGLLAITNQGTINATLSSASNSLTIQPGTGGVTNTATLEATGGGSLILNGGSVLGGATFTNTGGTIRATGTGSVVTLENSAIVVGGTITDSSGGLIQTPAGHVSTLNGVTNSGTYAIQNNAVTNLVGTMTNTGTIQLNSVGNFTELVSNGNVSLTGGGTVTLSNNSANLILGAVGANRLTNVNNTIQGSGNIGDAQMGLTNQSVIDANQSIPLTIQTSTGTTNSGTLEATNGATLNLIGDTYTNIGTIQAVGAGSTVNLEGGVLISGGTITDSTGGIVQVPSGHNVTLTNVTNTGTYAIQNNAVTNLVGTMTNNGTIQSNSVGNFTELVSNGNVSLTGGGTVTLSNNSANLILGAAGANRLTNVNNTIQGSGNIGDAQMGLTNQSVIDANQSNPLTIQTSTGTTNSGTLEATNGATLILSGDTFTNTGTIQAVGASSAVNLLNNVTVNGGTLTTSGGGVIQTPAGYTSNLNGITNSGTLAVQNNAVTIIGGTITNNGAMQLNSVGNFTEILLNGNVTLGGTGTLTLSNNPNNYIFGVAGTEVFTNASTIQGSGNIGNTLMSLVNNGTVLANQANELFIDTNASGFTNNGTVAVNSGSILDIEGGPFTNFSGTTLTGGTYTVGGTLQFTGANIVTNAANISLTSPTAQIVNQSNANALAGLTTNATGSSFSLSGGANFTTAGNFTNNGKLTVGSGDTFKVTGNLTNFASSTLTGGTYNVAGTLQFGTSGSSVTTNAANLTLRGTTFHLLDLGNNNLLAAFATNTSAGSFTVAGGGSFTTASNFTNAGSIDLEQGSSLTVTGNLANTGTVATNSGNLLGGNNTLTVTGTLTNSGAGSVTIGANNDTADVANVAHLANSAPITVGTGATLNLTSSGADTNTSTITLNGSTLKISGAGTTTLSGTGGIVNLSNNAASLITGAGANKTLSNAETIEGGGTISNLKITDTGTLLANQSTPLIVLPAAGGLTVSGPKGNLTVSTGDTMQIGTSAGGALANFAGTTLTGGIYNVSGSLQFGAPGTSLATNAANITLTGAGSQIVDFGNSNILAAFATNNAGATFALGAGRSFTTAGNFTNNGTLSIGTGDSFIVNGNLTNFAGTTLTGGIYKVNGILQFNGASIATNAANITLTGVNAKIQNQTAVNALLGFNNNLSTGSFALAAGARLTTTGGNFTNAGIFNVSKGTTFNVGGASFNFTQSGGTTTVDGTLTSTTAGTLTLNGGSLFGGGTLGYAVADNTGAITPGDSALKTGALAVTKTYTQGGSGVLNIAVGGTTAGTKFDQLNVTSTAGLGGILDITLINGFVPTIGNTFDILNASSVSGTFGAVIGTSINGSEHFSVTYNANDVLLTVVAGASPTQSQATRSSGVRGGWRPGLVPAHSYNMALVRQPKSAPAVMPHMGIRAHGIRPMDFPGMPISLPAVTGGSETSFRGLAPLSASSFNNIGMQNHRRLEVVLDWDAMRKTSPKRLLKALFADPDSPDAVSIGYVSYTAAH